MAYLGRQPIIGNYQVLDALTASATATYALTKNSVAVFPQTPANCIVSLNGVIQAPLIPTLYQVLILYLLLP
jgi:hypothetical protein